jgi:hypothetical protein
VVRQAGHDGVDATQGLPQAGVVGDVEGPDLELDPLGGDQRPRRGVEADDLEPGIGQQQGDQLADLAEPEHRDLMNVARHESSYSTMDRIEEFTTRRRV